MKTKKADYKKDCDMFDLYAIFNICNELINISKKEIRKVIIKIMKGGLKE